MKALRWIVGASLALVMAFLVLPVSAASADSSDSGSSSAVYFVIGDGSNVTGGSVTYWGAQWWKDNSVSAGSAPASFKGFADTVTFNPGGCSGTFTASPGNSSSPPPAVDPVIPVLVATSVTKDGPVISGTFAGVVDVATDPGYAPDPGHAGTGTDLGSRCGGSNG